MVNNFLEVILMIGNYTKTALFLAFMTSILLAIGYLAAGSQGTMVAFVAALLMNFGAYWFSDQIVLRMQAAQPVDPKNAPRLYQTVSELAQKAGIPMPKIYIIQSDQANAFATGRNPDHAAVAVTTGLLRYLDWDEVTAVLAHELAHIRNRDTLVMTIAATIAGAIGLISQFAFMMGHSRSNQQSSANPIGLLATILLIVLAPMAAMLVHMAISRSREYVADKVGAQICGHPLWLASALQKIAKIAAVKDMPSVRDNPATAHLYIFNPLNHRGLSAWFSTHPSLESRIQRLVEMAKSSPSINNRAVRRGPWG